MPSFLKIEGIIAAIGSATLFFLLCQVNHFLFSQLVYSPGVNWVFLPSGLRLLLVLMLGGPGAIGVVVGSLLDGLIRAVSLELALAAAVVSGLSPWLARWVCLKAMNIQKDLREISALRLFQMALVFSMISALLHQSLYVGVGLSQGFMGGAAVMAIGDMLGTLVVLYGIRLALSRAWRPDR